MGTRKPRKIPYHRGQPKPKPAPPSRRPRARRWGSDDADKATGSGLFIDSEIRRTASCPTYDEIAKHLSIKSKPAVHALIVGLEKRGFISRTPRRHRSIEVLRRPALAKDGDMSVADLVTAATAVLEMIHQPRGQLGIAMAKLDFAIKAVKADGHA